MKYITETMFPSNCGCYVISFNYLLEDPNVYEETKKELQNYINNCKEEGLVSLIGSFKDSQVYEIKLVKELNFRETVPCESKYGPNPIRFYYLNLKKELS